LGKEQDWGALAIQRNGKFAIIFSNLNARLGVRIGVDKVDGNLWAQIVRDWLAGQSFETQYEYGMGLLRRFGIIP